MRKILSTFLAAFIALAALVLPAPPAQAIEIWYGNTDRTFLGTTSVSTFLCSETATFNKTAQASASETVVTFGVSDDATGMTTLTNGTSTDAAFVPFWNNISAGTSTAGFYCFQGTTDTGSSPIGAFRARIGASTNPTTRPMFAWQMNATTVATMLARGKMTFTPSATSSGAVTTFTITPPNDTGQTASTEISALSVAGATRTWAAGALTTNRENLFAAPTYAFASASTITNAATVAITAAPAAGTNATITNSYPLWVQAGRTRVDGGLLFGATGAGGPFISSGTGTPEGAVTAPIGSIFMRTDGGAATSMYVKESGSGNTGWVGK